MAERWHTYIRTYTGQKFYPLDPDPFRIRIEDIAHALAQNCRFCGHTRFPYSVGQHSVYCALVATWNGLSVKTALACLLHDASEAYISDIARPLKHTATFQEYRKAEALLQGVIYCKFGLPPVESRVVKHIDSRMLATEIGQLMVSDEPLPFLPYELEIERWTPEHTKKAFLMLFRSYNHIICSGR